MGLKSRVPIERRSPGGNSIEMREESMLSIDVGKDCLRRSDGSCRAAREGEEFRSRTSPEVNSVE